MSMETTRRFLETWHVMVRDRRLDLLDDLIADDTKILSPIFYSAKPGKPLMIAVLSTVITIFEDFRYASEWVKDGEVILEFEAHIGDKHLKGIDRITLDEAGRIAELEVLIRPLNALMVFAGEMRNRLQLPAE